MRANAATRDYGTCRRRTERARARVSKIVLFSSFIFEWSGTRGMYAICRPRTRRSTKRCPMHTLMKYCFSVIVCIWFSLYAVDSILRVLFGYRTPTAGSGGRKIPAKERNKRNSGTNRLMLDSYTSAFLWWQKHKKKHLFIYSNYYKRHRSIHAPFIKRFLFYNFFVFIFY